MSRVLLNNVSKKYGNVTALKTLNLEIEEGEFITLLGPSGCGKTTTLRLIAGFIDPTKGQILLGDDDVTRVAPQNREIGMVFQDYALFPHLTIRDNIAFPLRERKKPTAEINKRVAELLELVHLPDVGDRFPSELSGGQAQRIAVVRAVSYLPRVLLMDEPLGALDLKLRETMQHEIRRIQQELKITTVFVTHDQTEAMTMSDRIAVMNNGELVQIGSGRELYNNPVNPFVADFIGRINLLDGEKVGQEDQKLIVKLATGDVVQVRGQRDFSGQNVTLGVRPENLFVELRTATPKKQNTIAGRITNTNFSGNLVDIEIDIGIGKPVLSEMRPRGLTVQTGDEVSLSWDPLDNVLMPA